MQDNTDNTNTNDNEWRNRELGALWVRSGKSQKYLTGTIKVGEFGLEQEIKVIIFSNKHKAKNERAPDYVVYESKELNDSPPAQQSTPVKEVVAESTQEEEIPEVFQ